MKKLFGGIDLTWKKLIIFAVLAGVYTALMAIIPCLLYTSFIAITATFEAWILFGIIIIMNSKSNKDAALKCFVFFLISQPLVYLLQVPFSRMGWGLFGYYKFWFIWTILCLPMGYIGYYMKKGKWWGYLILFPMILLTAYQYMYYLPTFMFSYPRYLLVCLFCIIVLIIYPLYIFDNKKIKITGVVISAILIVLVTVLCFMKPPVYDTTVGLDGEKITEKCKAYLEDSKYGKVEVIYDEGIDDYLIHAEFIKAGTTTMIFENSKGEKERYKLTIERTTYTVDKEDVRD